MRCECKLLQAKDGNKVPVMQRGNETYTLGSLYDGNYAAERWMLGHMQENLENVILFGLGDCQIVLKVLERVPGRVLVYEPDEKIYGEIKRLSIFKKIQKNHRFSCFYGQNQREVLQGKMIDVLNDDCVDRTALLTIPGYVNYYMDAYIELADMCQRICDAIQFTQGAIQRSFPTMLKNQLRNIPYLKDAIPLTRLAEKWDTEIPVILVAAGPSLLKNIEQLKKIDKRAFVFCVDTALSTLLRNGIVPDLVGSIDAVKNMDCFSEPGSYNIPYFVTCNSRYELVSKLTKERIWGKDHGCIRMILEKYGIQSPKNAAQFGVAGEMFAMLMELGVKKIIMIGQDLAYSAEKETHIDGRNEGFNETEAILVEGYNGDKVYSRMDWNKFRVWFEEAIERLPFGCEVINATEGGAKIHGAFQLPLHQVVEQLPERKAAISDYLSVEGIRITEHEYEQIRLDWANVRSDLENIKQWGYHKTFFESDYRSIPAMDMVLGAMRYLKDVSNREERFERAVNFVYDHVIEWEKEEKGK